MVSTVQSCALVGLEPFPVVCEVDLSRQLPGFTLVGLPGSITQESRDRIRAAVSNAGFEWPARKITVNLLPASVPKWGSHFELAMALGILLVDGGLAPSFKTFAVGELSLSGEIRPCGWLAAIGSWLIKTAEQVQVEAGEPLLVIAHERDVASLVANSPALANYCELVGTSRLDEAYRAISEASARLSATKGRTAPAARVALPSSDSRLRTLASVKNEPLAVIAGLVAITGRHHALFAGPYGMGKSMMIRAISEGRRSLSEAERVERATVLTMFGDLGAAAAELNAVYLQTSVSRAALEGALLTSGQVFPGEMTRAHLGLLVADELLEFRRDVVEALRQPIEEGVVRLQRAKFRTVLPASFQFLASTNLCPCGLWGQARRPCRCANGKRREYQRKLSGPIIDRFDLIVVVGHRAESSRVKQIAQDLMPLVADLLDSSSWEARIESATRSLLGASGDSADLLDRAGSIPTHLSDRGRLKLAGVAKTLAALLTEEVSLRHFRLALALRQDLDLILREEVFIKSSVKSIN